MGEGETETESLVGGRYRLLEVAGHGAMATVHRALDEVLGRDVAVKTFRMHAPDPRHEERRRGEMQVLARLNHPSLVRLYDAGTDHRNDGTAHVAYLVMEFVEGTDLRQRLADGPLAPDAVRALALDMAGALAYVHRLGIVHRDIKPANILVPSSGGSGPAKLTDFGIARVADASRLTLTNTTIGTANYLSPEQARGEQLGPASDVYSLGLVLLECLTGRMEFTGGAVEAAVARLMRDPHVPAELGEPWAPLLARMTARDPEARPPAEDVLAVLRGEAPATAGAGPGSAPTMALGAFAAHDAGTRLMASAHPAPDPPFVVDLPPETMAAPIPPPHRQRRKRRPLAWIAAIVLLLAALLVAVPLAITGSMSGSGTAPSAPPGPSAPVTQTPVPSSTPTEDAEAEQTPTPTPAPTKGKGKGRGDDGRDKDD